MVTDNRYKYFVRIDMRGKGEDLLLIFKNVSEMSTKNTINIIRERTNIYKDKLYLVDEYGREMNKEQYLAYARTYECNRRM